MRSLAPLVWHDDVTEEVEKEQLAEIADLTQRICIALCGCVLCLRLIFGSKGCSAAFVNNVLCRLDDYIWCDHTDNTVNESSEDDV